MSMRQHSYGTGENRVQVQYLQSPGRLTQPPPHNLIAEVVGGKEEIDARRYWLHLLRHLIISQPMYVYSPQLIHPWGTRSVDVTLALLYLLGNSSMKQITTLLSTDTDVGIPLEVMLISRRKPYLWLFMFILNRIKEIWRISHCSSILQRQPQAI